MKMDNTNILHCLVYMQGSYLGRTDLESKTSVTNHKTANYCGVVMLAILRHKSTTRFLYGCATWTYHVHICKHSDGESI